MHFNFNSQNVYTLHCGRSERRLACAAVERFCVSSNFKIELISLCVFKPFEQGQSCRNNGYMDASRFLWHSDFDRSKL